MSSSVVTTTMMRLPAEKLEAIQAEFEEEEEGLTVHQFVAVMAKYLNLEADLAALDLDDVVDGALESQARQDAEAEAVLQELAISNGDAVPVTAMPSASVLSLQPSTLTATRGGGEGSATLEVVSDVARLFAQIDANGDGTLEWDEFTNFVVNRAWPSRRTMPSTTTLMREGQSPFGARSSEDKYEVHSMRYFPEVQRLFVCVDNQVEILDVYARSDLMRQGLRLLQSSSRRRPGRHGRPRRGGRGRRERRRGGRGRRGGRRTDGDSSARRWRGVVGVGRCGHRGQLRRGSEAGGGAAAEEGREGGQGRRETRHGRQGGDQGARLCLGGTLSCASACGD